MSYRIITHNGKAHMDELIGIALITIFRNEMPTEILRVEQDEAKEYAAKTETDEIDSYIVDCGLELDPENFMFDHHQCKDLDCAALLIFNHYFSDLDGTHLHDYIKLVSAVDTRGPNALDDFKFNSDSINYFSFPQRLILKEFENQPLLINSLFVNGIKDIISFEEDKKLAELWVNADNNSSIIKIDSVNLLVYNNPPPAELSNAIKAIDSEVVEENNIHVVFGFDKENNEIRTLYRTFKGDDAVDFSKAEVNETLFCHKAGFLLKFIPETTEEWISIIKQSIK